MNKPQNHTKYALILIGFLMLSGCIHKKQGNYSVPGLWKSTSGGSIKLNPDSTFTADSLPVAIFFKDQGNEKFSGNGTWETGYADGGFTVFLDFKKNSHLNMEYSCSLNVADLTGSGKKKQFYLFIWKIEPGGDEYKFFRKDSGK